MALYKCLEKRSVYAALREFGPNNLRMEKFTDTLGKYLGVSFTEIPDKFNKLIPPTYLHSKINETVLQKASAVILVSTRTNKDTCLSLESDNCEWYSGNAELIIVAVEEKQKWNRWRQIINNGNACGKFISVESTTTKDEFLEQLCLCVDEDNPICAKNTCQPVPVDVQTKFAEPGVISSVIAAFLLGIILTLVFRCLRRYFANHQKKQKDVRNPIRNIANLTYDGSQNIEKTGPEYVYETIDDIPYFIPDTRQASDHNKDGVPDNLQNNQASDTQNRNNEDEKPEQQKANRISEKNGNVQMIDGDSPEYPCTSNDTDCDPDDHAYFILQAEV